MPKIYLDYAATTPVRPQIQSKILPYLTEKFGNPSSIHSFGREARKAVDEARENLAKFLNCQAEEIIFTSGGTESDNLAIKGLLTSYFSLLTSYFSLLTLFIYQVPLLAPPAGVGDGAEENHPHGNDQPEG